MTVRFSKRQSTLSHSQRASTHKAHLNPAVKSSKSKIHLVILRVQARKAKAPLCKGSCRGATEGLLVSLRLGFVFVHSLLYGK